MNTLETILTRRSIRNYADKAISDEQIHQILQAGMSGPSCVNARDFFFIVVRDAKKLEAMANANGKPADPLKRCTFAILVAGDLERAFEKAKDYWIIDCSIACTNMILAAKDLGIGSVWLGTWPQTERVKKQAELFDLPDTLIPHSIIAFGYPAEAMNNEPRDLYEESRVRFE